MHKDGGGDGLGVAGKRRYFYTATKVEGRVVKAYVGFGPLAELAAKVEALDRRRRRELAEALKADRARPGRPRRPRRPWTSSSTTWPRPPCWPPVITAPTTPPGGAAGPPGGPMPPEPPPATNDLAGLLDRARRGDAEALPALRAFLDDSPEVWRQAGDLAAHAQRAWVELAAGPDVLAREALGRALAALKAELAGPAPSPLERLLVERIAATWLQVHYADAAAAQARDVSVRQAQLAVERQDRAHRRHLAAVAALATIRRLLPAGPATANAEGPRPGPGRSPRRRSPSVPGGRLPGPASTPARPMTVPGPRRRDAWPGRHKQGPA